MNVLKKNVMELSDNHEECLPVRIMAPEAPVDPFPLSDRVAICLLVEEEY